MVLLARRKSLWDHTEFILYRVYIMILSLSIILVREDKGKVHEGSTREDKSRNNSQSPQSQVP